MKKRNPENYVIIDSKGYFLAYGFTDEFIERNLKTLKLVPALKKMVDNDYMYAQDDRELDAAELVQTDKVKKAIGDILIKLSENNDIAIKNGWNNPYFKEYCTA